MGAAGSAGKAPTAAGVGASVAGVLAAGVGGVDAGVCHCWNNRKATANQAIRRKVRV